MKPIISIVSFDEQQKHLFLDLLSDKEFSIWNNFRYPSRQHSWLAGRSAAKSCILKKLKGQHSTLTPQKIDILNDEKGRPYWQAQEVTNPQKLKLSIAHTGRVAIAVCSNDDVGIDIEPLGRNINTKMASFFLNEDETEEATLIQLWTLKEATLKLLGVGLKKDPKEVKIKRTKDNVFEVKDLVSNIKYFGTSYLFEDVTIAVVSLSPIRYESR